MAAKKLRGAGKGAEVKTAVAAKKRSSAVDGDAVPTRSERAEAFRESFNKSMKGRAMVKSASDYTLPYMIKRLPTGLLSLDVELGGGFPAGGLSQIAGPKNSGKSYLYWQVIRQLQSMLGDSMMVMLAMTEMRADRSQARSAGVRIALADSDVESMEAGRIKNGWPAYTAEERLEFQQTTGVVDELHGENAEDLYDGILNAIEAGIYHLVVIDSFGSIMSGAEAESDSLSDKQYAGASAVNTKFLRKLSALLTMDDEYGKARDVCVLGVNQIRDAIGDPNKDFKSPGGKALEHMQFVNLVVQSGKGIWSEEMAMTPEGWKKKFVQTGKEVNWKIEKGKAGIHEGGKGVYVYDFRINAGDFYSDTLVAGVQHGVIKTAGAWLTLEDPDTGAVLLRANGKPAFIEALSADAQAKAAAGDPNSAMNYIRTQVFRRKNININYDWADE